MNSLEKDIHRFGSKNKLKLFITNPMFRLIVLFRLNQKISKWNPFFIPLRIWFKNLSQKYGIQIPIRTKLGGGFHLNHYGGIVLNQGAKLGENCNVSEGVNIGNVSRGKLKGYPTIGNKDWIGANSVVVGNIEIGDDVLIAPLTYVNCDIPSNAVVSGNPCKVHSMNGSGVYIKNIYTEKR